MMTDDAFAAMPPEERTALLQQAVTDIPKDRLELAYAISDISNVIGLMFAQWTIAESVFESDLNDDTLRQVYEGFKAIKAHMES